jgi:DNA-binding CsgD family transcriptional regulator
MTSNTLCAQEAPQGDELDSSPTGWQYSMRTSEMLPRIEITEALSVPTVAESAEAVVEALDAPRAAAPALLDGLKAAIPGADEEPTDQSDAGAVSLDEYAKAVLYNGLGHYQAARASAQRACESDDFSLLVGALAELVEASVRSGSRDGAEAALARLESRAEVNGSEWAAGLASCARALLCDEDDAEVSYLEAIEWLRGTCARVALGRVHLLFGEWLRRRGRRVDARKHLTLALDVFREVSLSGFADRARRELLATAQTVRKRTDDTRLDLTAREAHIARIAAEGCTNPEIGEQLFLSPRTVEWHLRKIFTKLGISSRRQLNAILQPAAHVAPG